MQLTDHDLEEFCAIWKEEFKEDLLLAAAGQRASRLLELYVALATRSSAAAGTDASTENPSAS